MDSFGGNSVVPLCVCESVYGVSDSQCVCVCACVYGVSDGAFVCVRVRVSCMHVSVRLCIFVLCAHVYICICVSVYAWYGNVCKPCMHESLESPCLLCVCSVSIWSESIHHSVTSSYPWITLPLPRTFLSSLPLISGDKR